MGAEGMEKNALSVSMLAAKCTKTGGKVYQEEGQRYRELCWSFTHLSLFLHLLSLKM